MAFSSIPKEKQAPTTSMRLTGKKMFDMEIETHSQNKSNTFFIYQIK